MLADCLRDMGFEPCKMEPDIWLRPYGEEHYEYVAVYVEYLLITSKDPESIIGVLTNKHYFKLKGTDAISYHICCDFGSDDDSTLQFAPKKHTEIMVDLYYKIFGAKPKLSFALTLEKGDHPKLDTSECLDSDGIQKHQPMIGVIQ